MINPGQLTNPVLPTSSGKGGPPNMSNWYGKQILSLDGFTLTMGMVVLLIAVMLAYQTFFRKRR